MKERHDWRSACRRAGARTIISTFSLKGLRGEYRTLPRSVLLHAFGLLLSVRVCVAVRCAVVVVVESVKVCIQHSVKFPIFCPVFCSDVRNACDAVTWINSAQLCIRGLLELRSNSQNQVCALLYPPNNFRIPSLAKLWPEQTAHVLSHSLPPRSNCPNQFRAGF